MGVPVCKMSQTDSNDNLVLGGIEGGASKTLLILFNTKMKELATVEGPSTNVFQLGALDTARVIVKMIKEGLNKAGLEDTTKLKSLGMSLSGGEREETNKEIANAVEQIAPGMCEHLVVMSDTVGPLSTASPKGGLVLIAGTGSNALVVNPDGSTGRCGGWGHLIGDEGSASWVAFKAVKTFIDHTDNKAAAPFSVEETKEAIMEHFQINNRFDLLVPLYEKWDKTHFAGLCKRIAEGAEKGDPLCKYFLEEAGREMAAHLIGLLPSISQELLTFPGGLPVVCIGSVWKSWKFMEPGFVKELKSCHSFSNGKLGEVQLMTLRVPVPVGACYHGAQEANIDVPRDYANNTNTFYHGKF